MRTLQKSKAIDTFREEVYKVSDKVSQTVSMYECMKAFDNYLEAISGEWLEHQVGGRIYAKCSKCGSVHDTQSNYCPTCGCLMNRHIGGK